jgi:hypothetical protein
MGVYEPRSENEKYMKISFGKAWKEERFSGPWFILEDNVRVDFPYRKRIHMENIGSYGRGLGRHWNFAFHKSMDFLEPAKYISVFERIFCTMKVLDLFYIWHTSVKHSNFEFEFWMS